MESVKLFIQEKKESINSLIKLSIRIHYPFKGSNYSTDYN
jgi:hypothetical protein